MSEASRDDLIQSVMRKARDADCRIFDVRFTDLPGTWQHFSMPIDKLEDSVFEDGLGFDGSSVRGFQQIQESDMLVFPDPSTAFVDPTLEVPTLVMTAISVIQSLMKPTPVIHGTLPARPSSTCWIAE